MTSAKTPAPTTEALDLRIAIDTELRRLDWHWRHPRIKAWLYRVAEATGHPKTMVCDLTTQEMRCLLRNLERTPKQLELGGSDAS